jgi:hypothetical protein
MASIYCGKKHGFTQEERGDLKINQNSIRIKRYLSDLQYWQKFPS